MKKNILTLAIILASSLLIAQTEISLQINHKLASDDFAFDQESENDLADSFDVTRLEYYVSQISITHDGGLVTDIEDTWILVDAGSTTLELLGDYDITTVESISFGIGVESDVNHLDPSSYIGTHPLSHQSPSMHWGWIAGYRFVAFEGNCGSSLNEMLQIHALGDNNYLEQSIDLDLSAANGEIIISLDADYAQALSGINISSGLINHGESNEAADLLENFQTLVFSASSAVLSVDELNSIDFAVYPNPAKANSRLFISDPSTIENMRLIDYTGKVINQWEVINGSVDLDNMETGIYILSIRTQSGAEISKKVIIE